MERSSSQWNARLSLVPYTDRIQIFVLKHGDDDNNADEVLSSFVYTCLLARSNLKFLAILLYKDLAGAFG
jgi:hypothetical protein